MPAAARTNRPDDAEHVDPLDHDRRAWTRQGRLDSGEDVARVLAAVTTVGQRRDRTAGMTRVVGRTTEVALTEPDAARVLPIVAEFADLMPWPGGIRRGATLAATGSTSLIYALLAEAMTQGAWTAVVAMPTLNPLVAIEYGVDMARLALVPHPGDQWPEAVSALIDGMDIVVAATPADIPAGAARALMARARRRGCVLITTHPWPGCDLILQVTERRWLGIGHGRLRAQDNVVQALGRGRAERPRQVSTTLPPPSIAARVGPLPGQIPGLPIYDPDRVAQERLTSVAEPSPNPRPMPQRSPWQAFMDGEPPADAQQHHQRTG